MYDIVYVVYDELIDRTWCCSTRTDALINEDIWIL